MLDQKQVTVTRSGKNNFISSSNSMYLTITCDGLSLKDICLLQRELIMLLGLVALNALNLR